MELARVKMFGENNGARKLAENPVFRNRSKHIDVKQWRPEMGYISTEMAADVLTKSLPTSGHEKCLKLLNMVLGSRESVQK